jgi:hypothetical protein
MKLGLRLLIVLQLLIALAQTAFSYARFGYFSDLESYPPDDPYGSVDFREGDFIYGPLHSNGWIHINGNAGGYPQFYGPVTTAKEDVIWINGTPPDYDIFHAGLQVNYPDSNGYPFPLEEAIEFMWDNAGLPIWSTPAYIDSLGGYVEIATTIRMRYSHLQIEQWLYNDFYPNGDTIFYEERYSHGQILSLPAPQRGTVALRGKLFLEGVLRGQVSFLSADTIWIIDDVYYSDVNFDGVNWIGNPSEDEKGRPLPGSYNRLGIVSEKNVIIAFTPENGGYNGGQSLPGCDAVEGVSDREHILITAAIMALDNVFEIDFWHNSCNSNAANPYGLPWDHPCNTGMVDLRGNIYLWGSIIQRYHGSVQHSLFPNNYWIGYGSHYHHDENFAISYPPMFPIMMTDTLEVPEEFTTIQAAIDSSGTGDMILVSPGIYQENLVIDDKRITLTSRYQLDGDSSSVEETVIDGNGTGAVIRLQNGLSHLSRISGFTLTNGSGFMPDTSELTFGGAIYCYNSAPVLENLLITGNSADYGGAVFVTSSTQIHFTISQVTMTGNTATAGGALFCYENVWTLLENSIFWNNQPEEIHSWDCEVDAICCDIQGYWWGGDYIIDVDPLFCNPDGGHYRLLPDSPCRDYSDCSTMGYSDAQCDPEAIEEFVSQPATLYLSQNHPNPFNPSTTIEFSLPYPQEIQLEVYNIMGQRVAVLADGMFAAGIHRVTFNTNLQSVGAGSPRPHLGNLPTGIYIYRLTTGNDETSRKMLLVR